MSENSNNICVIDAESGIGTSSPQITQFTHNFNCIKFIIDKDFTEYAVVLITNADGNVNIVSEGEALTKSYDADNKSTQLLWYPQREVTCDSGVVVYQIAAYDAKDDKSVWYSKEGRLIVNDSIDTTNLSTELIGSYPNLITQVLTLAKSLELTLGDTNAEVSANKKGLERNKTDIASLNGDFELYKGTIHPGEETYNANSILSQSGRAVAQAVASIVNSAPETLNTLEELATALGNDPNFATTIMNLLGNKVDKGIFDSTVSELQEDSVIHKSNNLNPHNVTKEQVGLGNVDNTSDMDKPVSDAVKAELNNKVDKVVGKSLSSNDFTDADKLTLSNTRSDMDIMIEEITTAKEKIDNKVDKESGKGLSTIDFNEYWAEKVDNAYWGYEYIAKPPLTEISSTLVSDYEYILGEAESLSLTFPTVANDGDVIYLTFYSGAVPTTLTIDTTNTSDIDLIPEANTGYEIFGKYNGSIWIVNYSEYTVSEV